MDKISQIASSVSDAEIEILQLLWLESPLSAQEIIEKLQVENSSHPKTIKTLINRLLKKGALAFNEKNRKYYYYPTIKKDDFYKLKTASFMTKFFAGEISPLASFFSSHKKLNENEIAELKALIENMEQEESSNDS